jgi:hypothetical protein
MRESPDMGICKKLSRLELVTVAIVITVVICLLVVVVSAVKRAQYAARRSNSYGRLTQMRLALQNYESRHESLPPLYLRDQQGRPIHSWRAIVLPFLEFESLKLLDLSQSWDSDYNRKVVEAVPPRDWTWFARDLAFERMPVYTSIFALLGSDSIWDPTTGLPRGTTHDNPSAILLVSVPTSNIKPLEPRDITEAEVRAWIQDGKEVYFIATDRYGVVQLKNDGLVFRRWEEVHD